MNLTVAEHPFEGDFWEDILDTLATNIAVLDTEGTIRATNHAWQEFAETNDCQMQPDMVGMNYLDVIDAADDIFATRAGAGLRAVLWGKSEQFELEYPCHTPDEKRWFLLRARPFIHNENRYVTVTHVDITKRKKREGELNRYRQLVEGMADPAAILDENGRYEIVNESLARFRDTTQQALEGEQSPLVDQLRAESEDDPYLELIRGIRDNIKGEFTWHSSEQERITVEYQFSRLTIEGKPTCIVATCRDITQRKKQAAQLKDNREMLESVQQSMASTRPFAEKMADLLQYGREYLDVEQGFFTRIDDGTMDIRVAAGPNEQLQAGASAPLSETYCRHTIDSYTKGALTVEHADAEGWAGDPAFERFNLDCYIGATVLVDGDPYGTICFADRTPIDQPLTRLQRTFVELLTEWAGYELEQRKHEQQYRRLTDRITDAYYAFDADWTVTYWNESVENRTGILADDIVGTNFWEQFPELNDTAYEEVLRKARETGDAQSCEYYYDGGDYWIEVQVYPDEDGLTVISQEITERKEREQELAYRRALLEAQAESTIDGLLLVDTDRTVRYHNDRFLDIWNLSKEAVNNQLDEDLLKSVADLLDSPTEFRDHVEYLYNHPNEKSRDTIELTDGRWLDRYSAPVTDDDGFHYGRLWVFRDASDRIERERLLEQQRDELAQLQRLNTLVREIIQALQDTATQEGIETAVCERLTDSNLYQAVWIGRRTEATRDSSVLPNTVAGIDDAYLEEISGEESEPAYTALETGEVQIINDIDTTNKISNNRTKIEPAYDHQSLAAVPLTIGETTYGVLVVYAHSDHLISNPEQEVLADLGHSIALAIQRVHSQRSLTSETAVALDLRIPDADFPFATISTELGCELTLDRRVPMTDGPTIYYITVDGADPIHVCEMLENDPLVGHCTVVSDDETADSTVIETHLDEKFRLPLDVLTDYGASLKRASAVDGDILLSVELPPELEIRTVLFELREIAPNIKIVSKHQIDRPMATISALQNQLNEQLTPKQEATLKAAMARGYYSWPRDTTVEELADTFNISSPAVHYRLRKAHHAVITTLLNGKKT